VAARRYLMSAAGGRRNPSRVRPVLPDWRGILPGKSIRQGSALARQATRRPQAAAPLLMIFARRQDARRGEGGHRKYGEKGALTHIHTVVASGSRPMPGLFSAVPGSGLALGSVRHSRRSLDAGGPDRVPLSGLHSWAPSLPVLPAATVAGGVRRPGPAAPLPGRQHEFQGAVRHRACFGGPVNEREGLGRGMGRDRRG
jgi:hypothetical protein